MATSPERPPRPTTPGRGAVPVFVRIPRRASRFGWTASDAAHGALLGVLLPVIAVPFLLPAAVTSGTWAGWSLLGYVAWLAAVAKFAVGFVRAGERAGLITLLVISCVASAAGAQSVVQAVNTLLGR